MAPLLEKLPLPKRMRWGKGEASFIRPVHWLCCLLDDTVIPIQAFAKTAANISYGHRFIAPDAITIKHATEYESQLENANVIVDANNRKQEIIKQLAAHTKSLNCSLASNASLLEEVTALVEKPHSIVATFSERFLSVPKEALILAITHHQKCFPLQDSNGKLLNKFLVVANMPASAQDNILKGNERVMAARLSDALFFFENDKKISLNKRLEQLKTVIFHPKLGSMFDKAQRVAHIAKHFAKEIQQPEKMAHIAGLYAKADLSTDMVGEFPELQGIMGYYLCLHEKKDPHIAQAIKESYLPQGPFTPVPASKLGAIVAVADKIDSLVGHFAINANFSAEKDPFGLRRHALGIVRILIEHQISIDLSTLIDFANQAYNKQDVNLSDSQALLIFFLERLRHLYVQKGYDARIAHAVIAKFPTNPYDYHLRMEAVQQFIALPEAKELAELNKRVSNILSKQDVLNGTAVHINPELFKTEEENALNKLLNDKHAQLEPLFEAGKYEQCLTELVALKSPIDKFFDKVMVMVEDTDIKKNRLALLSNLENILAKTADISKLL